MEGRALVIPAEGVSPRAGTQGNGMIVRLLSPWVPDISLTRNSGMTVGDWK